MNLYRNGKQLEPEHKGGDADLKPTIPVSA